MLIDKKFNIGVVMISFSKIKLFVFFICFMSSLAHANFIKIKQMAINEVNAKCATDYNLEDRVESTVDDTGSGIVHYHIRFSSGEKAMAVDYSYVGGDDAYFIHESSCAVD